jgi:hypothetical protein
VFGTAVQGWRVLVADWSVLLRIAWLPLGVIVALDFYLGALFTRQFEGPAYTNLDYADRAMTNLINLDMVVALFLGGLIVALWHRARLTGRQTLSMFRLLAAWRNVAALAVLWCSLILINVGLTWVVGSPLGPSTTEFLNETLIKKFGLISYPTIYRVLMDVILDGGPLLIAFHISGRLGLMLWARPAGGEGALDRAWAAGDGNGWRIAAAIFVAILPVMIVASALPPMLGGADFMLYLFLPSDLSNLLQLIVAAGVIAVAHETLLGGQQARETPAPADATED